MEPLLAGVRPGIGRNTPPTLGSVSMEAVQEASEIFIFANVEG